MAPNPDGGMLAVGTQGGDLQLEAIETGERLITLTPALDGPVLGLAFLGEGTTLAASGMRSIALWHSGRLTAQVVWQPTPIRAIAFAPDVYRSATIATTGNLSIWMLAREGGTAGETPLHLGVTIPLEGQTQPSHSAATVRWLRRHANRAWCNSGA